MGDSGRTAVSPGDWIRANFNFCQVQRRVPILNMLYQSLASLTGSLMVFAIIYALWKSNRRQLRRFIFIFVPVLALSPVIDHYVEFLPYEDSLKFLVVSLISGLVGLLAGGILWLIGRGRKLGSNRN
jgi:hypothetical protein